MVKERVKKFQPIGRHKVTIINQVQEINLQWKKLIANILILDLAYLFHFLKNNLNLMLKSTMNLKEFKTQTEIKKRFFNVRDHFNMTSPWLGGWVV